jgi:hypothetical protein
MSEDAGYGPLGRIAKLRYGSSSEASLAELRNELVRFAERDKYPISRAAVYNWFMRGARPKREKARTLIKRYLSWLSESGQISRSSVIADVELREFLGPGLLGPDVPFPGQAKAQVMSDLEAMVGGNAPPQRRVENDFFYCSRSSNLDQDESYYAMYRHSSLQDDIIKSLLVLRYDSQAGLSFLRSSVASPDRFLSDIRQTRGSVFDLGGTYQFFGQIMRVTEMPDRHAQFSLDVPTSRPLGIETIAFQQSAIAMNPGLFSGITMTIGHTNQPIAARVAMVHLGTRDWLGGRLDEFGIEPSYIRSKELVDDLFRMTEALGKHSSVVSGPALYRIVKKSERGGVRPRLGNQVLAMLNNIPSFDLARETADDESNSGRKAIEPFSEYLSRIRG